MSLSPYEQVKTARSAERPTSLKYIRSIFTDFISLSGDRRYGNDRAIEGGIAFIDELPCTVIGIEKGNETADRIARNFGSAHPEGYRKALRLMKQAEKFGRPVFCFIDIAGAYCGIAAEERGQGQAIAENLMEMMSLRVPILSILIGEGGSGGALALSVADEVWMMENSVYSVISPEGCASILWKDPSRVEQAASSLKLTSDDLLRFGMIEKIIPLSTDLSENSAFEDAVRILRDGITDFIVRKTALSPDDLIKKRYERFRKF